MPEIVVIRGNNADSWRDSASRLYAPTRMLFAIDADEENLPGLLAERAAVNDETLAYRCVGTHCELPVKSWEALAALL